MQANEFFKKVGIDAVRSYLAAYEDASRFVFADKKNCK